MDNQRRRTDPPDADYRVRRHPAARTVDVVSLAALRIAGLVAFLHGALTGHGRMGVVEMVVGALVAATAHLLGPRDLTNIINAARGRNGNHGS